MSSEHTPPQHIAIIMDGNGRWARARNLPRIAGHKKGLGVLREVVKTCVNAGVPYVTAFAFSSENWRRPGKEVRFLVELFATALVREVNRLHKNNIRFRMLGEPDRFGSKVTRLIQDAEQLTAANTACTLSIAANYGGRWDITQACRRIARQVESGALAPADIDQHRVQDCLASRELPDPDLFIRTGGEQRISNFMLWQLAYSELYFTDVLWPEFDQAALKQAMAWYAGRQRRFGQTGEQLNATEAT